MQQINNAPVWLRVSSWTFENLQNVFLLSVASVHSSHKDDKADTAFLLLLLLYFVFFSCNWKRKNCTVPEHAALYLVTCQLLLCISVD